MKTLNDTTKLAAKILAEFLDYDSNRSEMNDILLEKSLDPDSKISFNQLRLELQLYPGIRSAAKSLGSSKKKRRSAWTGCIQNERVRKGQRVILPNGTIAMVCRALRGKVICCWEDPHSIPKSCAASFKDTALKLYKDPAAVLLGSLKKGVTEKKSHAKSEAARKNGSKPPRPGNRPRGRPRKRV